jgi:carbon-monoxide dehydrogenase medium subunit
MHEAILQVGHRQTRNRGTIGGSLCHLDPAAELVSVAAALDATVSVAGPNGTREIAFADFPVAYMTPAIEPQEILTAVRIPTWPQGHGHAFIEFSRRHGDFAIVSAAALIEADTGGRIKRASLTLGGMGQGPVRARDVERALIGQAPGDDLFRQVSESCREIEATDDIHASAGYRQHLAAVLARRALVKSAGRLGGQASPSRVH